MLPTRIHSCLQAKGKNVALTVHDDRSLLALQVGWHPGAEHGIIKKHRQHQRHAQAQWGARAQTTARGRAKWQGLRMVQSVTCALLLHDSLVSLPPFAPSYCALWFASWPPPFLSGSLCGQGCPVTVTLLIPVLLLTPNTSLPPSFQGPSAVKAVQALAKDDLSKFYFSNFKSMEVAGVPVWITRTVRMEARPA